MQLVKVGLCAYGMSGQVFHAPFLKEHPGFFMAAVVERHQKKAQEKYPEITSYTSVSEMLKNADLDWVVVNSPVQTHYQYTKEALCAGKNVIVEKPFTVNAQEAEELSALAQERHLSLSVYQNRRYDRDFLEVKKVVEAGYLGKIKEVEIRFDRYRPQPSGKEHKENPDFPGSGAWHDLGAHLVDQATQLFGKPKKVLADIFSMKGKNYANDYFEVILFYSNELRVRLKSSVFTKEDHYAYKVFGERGCFLQERTDNQEAALKDGALPELGKNWQPAIVTPDGVLNCIDEKENEHRIFTSSTPGNYMNYYEDIYAHIVFGEALPSPADEVLENMKIIDAALESASLEMGVNLP